MKKLKHGNLTVEMFKEDNSIINSMFKKNTYERVFVSDEKSSMYSSLFGLKYISPLLAIRVFENEKEISNCLLAPSHSSVFIGDKSVLIEGDKLVLCWGDTVFCLSVPDLELIWKTRADQATCFDIYKLDEDYLIHGELNISRISKDGKLLWEFGARDIFVSDNGKDIFELHSDHILVSDFENTVYKLDFAGNCIDEFKIQDIPK